jgi:rhamnosyltransferase
MNVACVVPTYNNKRDLERLLDSLEGQRAAFDVLIVDSSSTDGTRELGKARAHKFSVVASAAFNHGGTRQQMVNENFDYDIYVFLTQDACLLESNAISELLALFNDENVGAVCGRQMPHSDATIYAQHARHYNYPRKTQIRTIKDAKRLGIKTAFMSNSFAAYRGSALKTVGGFPSDVIFAEDMYVAARMLVSGWKVAYAGAAVCAHSHNYTILEEFRRYFDMGVFHARESWIGATFGHVGGEGLKYQISELKFIGLKRPVTCLLSMVRSAAKLTGYQLGKRERFLPVYLKRRFGMHRAYWNNSI